MTKTMTTITLGLLLTACSGQDEAKSTVPTPAPTPVEPAPTPSPASASIASVEMLQDCPDPKPATPARTAPASMAAPADSAYPAPCQQSRIQIAFEARSASKVMLKQVRLLTPSGQALGTVEARLPSMWNEQGYVPWDETLAPDTELKASYKITPPDWSSVESKLGGTSYGAMFLLEVDLDIGGETRVLRSSEFARQRPEMVPT